MAPLAQDIRNANAAAERILAELFTRSFAYTIEHKDGSWTLRVECALEQGWRMATFAVDPAELAASLREPAVAARLRAAWRERVAECANSAKSEQARVAASRAG